MKKWFGLTLSILLLAGLVLSACGKTEVPATTQPPVQPTAQPEPAATQAPAAAAATEAPAEKVTAKDTIVVGLFTSPTGVFNPIFADSDYDIAINDVVYSSLMALNDKTEMVPGLAEKFEMSNGDRTITFFLRKNVKWHDGTPFTSKDVAFTFTTMAKKDYLGPLFSDVANLVGAKDVQAGKAETVEGIKVIDDYTISFTYNEVYAPGLIRIGTEVGILPEHYWGKTPVADWKNATDLMGKPIGTGPYIFKEFVPGQFVKLEANPDYFMGAPKTNNFVFQVTNQDTAIAAMTNGEIDIADVSNFKPNDLKQLQEAGIKTLSFAGKSYQYMGFNMRLDVFKQKELRHAITYAIDRKTVIQQILGGNATLINAPMLPNTWQYPSSGLNEYEFNPEKSKEILKSIGYTDTNGNGIVDKDGKDLTFTLKYPIGNKIREQYATIIKKYLSDIGIGIELKLMEFSTLLEETMSNHDFDLYLMGSSLSLDPDPIPYWSTSASSDEKGVAAWNIPAFRNEKADELMLQGIASVEQSKRAEIYKNFAVIFNDDPPIVLLYAPNITKAFNPGLQNYRPATFVNYYDVHEWVINK
ncbi:MAG: peptide-binding protein [Anaerolineaceae bacterium]|nr:peptide-binding protein [Anaerolineaceae bacterium]